MPGTGQVVIEGAISTCAQAKTGMLRGVVISILEPPALRMVQEILLEASTSRRKFQLFLQTRLGVGIPKGMPQPEQATSTLQRSQVRQPRMQVALI